MSPAHLDQEPVSMTEVILEWIDPSSLPATVQASMEQIGYWLQIGLTHREIAQQLDPPRSEDWVTTRVHAARKAIAQQVLDAAGDELPAGLRTRLEQYVAR